MDNPLWKEKWRQGKRIYDEQWNVRLQVIKGSVDSTDDQAEYQVDGLSGATITSNGVTNMLEYWFGDHGFGPFLRKAHACAAHVGCREDRCRVSRWEEGCVVDRRAMSKGRCFHGR